MSYTFRQAFMPYCIRVLGDGWFILLNRKYKPIGITSSEWIEYEQHPSRVRLKGLTDARARTLGLNLVTHEGGSEKTYYFYDDGTAPDRSKANWERYQDILKKLMKYEVTQEA